MLKIVLLSIASVSLSCNESGFRGEKKEQSSKDPSNQGTPTDPTNNNQNSVWADQKFQIQGDPQTGDAVAFFLRDTSSSMKDENRTYGNTTVQGIMSQGGQVLKGITFCQNGGTKTGAVYNLIGSALSFFPGAGGANRGCDNSASTHLASIKPNTKIGLIVFSDWGPTSFSHTLSEAALKATVQLIKANPNVGQVMIYWILGDGPKQKIAAPYFESSGIGKLYSFTDSPQTVVAEVAKNLTSPIAKRKVPMPPAAKGKQLTDLELRLNGNLLDNSMVSLNNDEFTIAESLPLAVGDQLTVKIKSVP